MLCENCKVNTATTHIKNTVNGVTGEYFLCPECAAKLGFNNFNFFKLDDFWNSLLSEPLKKKTGKRCGFCNTSFDEIVNSGKMGCENCYIEFKEEIMPTILKIHGKNRHIGSKPEASESFEKPNDIEALEKELKEAIEKEEFEKAAKLRDELREKRSENNG